jgi:ParB family chromosome partitioning protein
MALGRGLGELLGEIETAYGKSTGATVPQELDIDLVIPNPHQPRRVFNEEKLQELSNSILIHGLLQPILVVPEDDHYILIAGERRLRASKMAGFEKIKANIAEIDPKKFRELAIIENIQRDDLNVIELAYSYAQLINEHSLTHEDLAKVVSKSRASVTNTLRLLTLSVYAQQMIGNDKISGGHAKVLVGLPENDQKVIIDTIIGQKLSVRETEKLVSNMKQEKHKTDEKDNKNKIVHNFDFSPLNVVIEYLQSQNYKIKTDKNFLKIEVNSQEDIEKLSKYLKNSIYLN